MGVGCGIQDVCDGVRAFTVPGASDGWEVGLSVVELEPAFGNLFSSRHRVALLSNEQNEVGVGKLRYGEHRERSRRKGGSVVKGKWTVKSPQTAGRRGSVISDRTESMNLARSLRLFKG